LNKYPHLKWKSEKDRGQTHALNKALEIVKGEVICWLNSDDLLCEGAFNAVNDFFIKNENAHVVIGGLIFVNEHADILWRSPPERVDYNGLLNEGQCVQQPSTFFRKDVFKIVGQLDEKYHYTMDHEYWLRVSKVFDYHIINNDLAKFRLYSNSKSGTSQLHFIKETIKMKIKYKAKLFTMHNLQLILMFVKEPFKKIHWLRVLVRKLKGANPDSRYYN
jgi:glycosyltransferase involved in cell wall biosynthesis